MELRLYDTLTKEKRPFVPLDQQDSGMLGALAMADALIRVPAHAPPQDAGAMVDYITIA